MTEIDLPDDTLDFIEEVFDTLAQGYGINVPTEDSQENYLEAHREITKARADDDIDSERVPATDGEFDFETDDILP